MWESSRGVRCHAFTLTVKENRMSGKNFKRLALCAIVVIGGLILINAFSGHGNNGTVTHSQEWQEGYTAGLQMYNQLGYGGDQSVKNPYNADLVNYCDESAYGVEPQLS